MTFDLLLDDCHAATMAPGASTAYGAIRDAAIAFDGGRIAWIGPAKDRPPIAARESFRLGGAWVTPGLIDCHTHLVFAGNRAHEWEQRRKGASYEEIARAGGGILSTVKATREASQDALASSAAARARAMADQGVTTIEIKSGYGLDLETERKILRAAACVEDLVDVRVVRTFLGAHALPPEFKDRSADYVDLICSQMIPAIAREKLADSVDAFCETIGFTLAEAERVFAAAKAHGLPVKLHAEQLSDQGGAALAARYKALSADHLEHLSEAGVEAMARAGTVAVLLPCAFYFLRETKKPPIEALRRAGVPIAVATDCNPGTSPATSPLIALNMACTLYDLTPEEALTGMTRSAAAALGLSREIGTLEPGKSADLAIWNISDPAELGYWMGADLLRARYLGGRAVKGPSP
jgi:imidazolonepropionase